MIKLFTLIFSSLIFQLGYGQYEHLAVAKIDDSLLKNAYSIVRFDDMFLGLEDEKAVYNFDYAITVFDKKHEDKLSLSIGYTQKVKIKDLEIKILDKNGSIIKKIKKSEIEDKYPHGNELITDSRYKYFKYHTRDFPITCMYSYKIIDEAPTALKKWVGVSDFNMAVEKSSFYLYNKDLKEIKTETKNLEKYNVSCTHNKQYDVLNIKAITKERYMPDFIDIIPTVRIYPKAIKYFDFSAEINNWNQLSSWMYENFYLPQQTCDKTSLKKELDDVIGKISDKKEIAKRIYEYIQDETRYVAITLDEGGYVPLPTNVVHEKKYGDCKALSYYYHTLLSLYEIESTLAFVHAGRLKKSFDIEFVTPTYFNHVVNRITIDSLEYWADCTSSANPFNYLGTFSDDRQVLFSSSKNGEIGCTPKYKSYSRTLLDFTLDINGNIEGNASFMNTGDMIGTKLMSLPNKNEKERKKYHRDEVFKNFRNINVTTHKYKLDTANITFTEDYRYNSPSITEKLGNYLIMPSNLIRIQIPNLKKDKKRMWNIIFPRKKEFEIVQKIKLNDGLKPIVSEDANVESAYGNYSYTTKIENEDLIVTRKFILESGDYKPKEYYKIKTFLDKVKIAENQNITFQLK